MKGGVYRMLTDYETVRSRKSPLKSCLWFRGSFQADAFPSNPVTGVSLLLVHSLLL